MMAITRRVAPLLALSLVLGACGGSDKQKVTEVPLIPGGELVYSYPDRDQTGVSTFAPVVVHFSKPVAAGQPITDSEVSLRDAQGNLVPVAHRLAGDGRSVVLHPHAALAFNSEYRVQVDGLSSAEGTLVVPDGGFSFRTRAAQYGPRDQQQGSADFAMTRMFPDGQQLDIVDMTTFRFQFSQPIDTEQFAYGDSVKLTDGTGKLVPAVALAKGPYLTIDPQQDLTPGKRYVITFGNLTSTYGTALAAPFGSKRSFEFTPKMSGPRDLMALRAPNTGQPSILTGDLMNMVPVKSVLLGDDTESAQEGDVYTELGYAPLFENDILPVRLPRGGMLTGGALDVLVGGHVPAGFDSGAVRVQFITDATGYLLPNPHTRLSEAPRQLRMFMDVAIVTDDARANAAFNQDILHMELVGMAIVKDGVLVADAVTVVENDVLGVEYAHGTLSFHMESYRDPKDAPAQPQDTTPPQLLSWLPGPGALESNPTPESLEKSLAMRPGDPIVLNFTEPLEPSSLTRNVTLRKSDGSSLPVEIRRDGAAVVIRAGLELSESYTLELDGGITDLAGNALAAQTLRFDMPLAAAGGQVSPFVIGSYPGFPCVLEETRLRDGVVGSCKGTNSREDRLPMPYMPSDRPIVVRFSQPVNPDSVLLGTTFKVFKVAEDGTPVSGSDVDGELTVKGREMRFMPAQRWDEGALYAYELVSNGNARSDQCNPSSAICGANGLPLKTELFAQSADKAPPMNGGGAVMRIYFTGAEPVPWVFQGLDNLPTADINGNAKWDDGEGSAYNDPLYLHNSARVQVTGVGGSVAKASLGCDIGKTCPERHYIYQTGGLMTDVVGFISAEELANDPNPAYGRIPQEVLDNGGILVWLYPTVIQSTDLTVYTETTLGGIAKSGPAPTGPQYMRMRSTCDGRAPQDGRPEPQHSQRNERRCGPGEHGLIPSWIVDTGEGEPQYLSALDLYLDSPQLEPKVWLLGFIESKLAHNQLGYGFSLDLKGPLRFYDDGRLQIIQVNRDAVPLKVDLLALGFLEANVDLEIPAQAVNLNYMSRPAKH